VVNLKGDGLERLEVSRKLLGSVFAVLVDRSTEDDKPVFGNLFVEFESFANGCDCRHDLILVDCRFNVFSRTGLVAQLFVCLVQGVFLGRDVHRDH